MVNKIIRLLARKKVAKPVNFTAGERSLVNGVKVTVRSNIHNPMSAQQTHNLVIGNESIVSGNFVFENGLGRITIGNRSFIGGGDFICLDEIIIGDDVLISWGCTIMDNNAHSLDFEERQNDVGNWRKGIEERKIGFYKDWRSVSFKKIKIGDKAWIGFKSIILKGVTIGEGAIVAAGSVVTKDVPEWTVVAGNPAQMIKKLKS